MATFPSNSDVKANRSLSGRVVTVTEPADGGQFNSIKEAIDYADSSLSPTPTDPVVISVGKGDYNEDPITLPDNIYVKGEDKELVTIIPNNPATSVITTTGTGGKKEVSGVTIQGGTKAVEVGTPTEKMEIKHCTLVDQTVTPVEVTDPDAVVIISSADIKVETTAPTELVKATGGSSVQVKDTTCDIGAGVTVTTGLVSEGGSDLKVKGTSIQVAPTGTLGVGIYADQGTVDVKGDVEVDKAVVGVGTSNNLTSKVTGTGLKVTNSQVNDVQMVGGKLSVAEISVTDSQWDDDKVNAKPTGYKAVANKADVSDEAGVDYKVNQTLAATKGTATGESTSQDDFFVFTNTNGEIGAWVDESSVAKSPLSTFSLPGLTVGSALYFGSTEAKFGALQLRITTPKVEGAGKLEQQYWDGGSWVAASKMVHSLQPPYVRRADESMTVAEYQTVQIDEQIVEGGTPWVKKLLNGENAYWQRFIVTTAPITVAPILRRARLQNHLKLIDGYGKQVAHGAGREQVKKLLSDYRVPAVGAPTVIDKLISPNISVREPIEHPSGSDTKIILEYLLDSVIDTSSGVKVAVSWVPTSVNVGSVIWRLRSTTIRQKAVGTYAVSIVDGTLPEATEDLVVVTPGVTDQVVVSDFTAKIDVQKFTYGDRLVMTLERLGGTDTYPDAVHRLGVWVSIRKAFGGDE